MRVGREAEHPASQEAGHFTVCNYETYNPSRVAERDTKWDTSRDTIKEVFKENIKDTRQPAGAGVCVSPKILVEIYQQHNQALPEVKALTSERLRKCRSRINQAVRDGCLEQYLADFVAAVKKAQLTPFLRGEGARGWRAGFDWLVANHVNIYGVLEGKYDGPAGGSYSGKGQFHGSDEKACACDPDGTSIRRTTRGDPIYVPRQ